ncbi:hypothetical protein [Paenibacillus sp. IHBB 10380]|uniref:hypothetical protein n=1 Tax=Paenibacillus sp. IHBB 10380 TaxID=1566358 RepID=UPI0005CFB207|nr:hypothetical protein [Paenibacillus sp. IHBB 10380]AJS57811.1 hypothetical protein UB51_04140 [Paenibacillus sp. IHBB 10380]
MLGISIRKGSGDGMPTNKSWCLVVSVVIVIMLSGCSLEQEQSTTVELERLDSHNTPVMEEVYSDSVIEEVYSTDEISLP